MRYYRLISWRLKPEDDVSIFQSLFRDLSSGIFFLTTLTAQGLLAEDYQLRQPLKFYPIGFCWRRLPIFHGQLGLNAHMTPRVREGSDFHLRQQRCEYAVAKLPLLLLYSNGFSIRILFSLCWRSNACSKVEKGHQILKVRRRRLQP